MKRIFFLLAFLLFLATIFLLFYQPLLAFLSLIFFWLISFLILLTGNSTLWLSFITSAVFLLLTLFQLKNPIVAITLPIILFLIFFLREKVYRKKTEKELQVKTFARAYFDFRLFFRLLLYFMLLVLTLTSLFQEENFAKIFQLIFDTIDQMTASFQIGVSSKMTVADLLQKEAQSLQVPSMIETEFYQTALGILNQKFALNLKPETTLREIIWQNLNQSKIWKISFLIFLIFLSLSLFSFLILLTSLPSALLAQILVSVLIKLNLIRKATQKVDKEILII